MTASKKAAAEGASLESIMTEVPFIRRTLGRKGVAAHDLEDAVCTVLLGAVESAGRYVPPEGKAPPDALRAWLFGISRNVAGHYREGRLVAGSGLIALQVKAEGEGTPTAEELAAARERLGQVQAALGRLPEHVREAYILHDVEGETLDAIGAALGIPPSTVHKHVARARRAIATAIARSDAHDRHYASRRQTRSTTAAERRHALRMRLESAAGALEVATRALRLAIGDRKRAA